VNPAFEFVGQADSRAVALLFLFTLFFPLFLFPAVAFTHECSADATVTNSYQPDRHGEGPATTTAAVNGEAFACGELSANPQATSARKLDRSSSAPNPHGLFPY